MNNYLNYSYADRKTIEKIVTVKEHNATCSKGMEVSQKYGYVMPLYGGWQWAKTKQELINRFCFSPIK